jgi:hypothetical protein
MSCRASVQLLVKQYCFPYGLSNALKTLLETIGVSVMVCAISNTIHTVLYGDLGDKFVLPAFTISA